MKVLMLTTALFLCFNARAQYTERFQEEFFFGHMNNASTEAMGRADAAIGGKVFSARYNPAGSGTIEQREIAVSTSGPYYILRESDFYNAGFAQRVNEKLCLGIDVNQFAVGPTTFTTDIGTEQNLALDKPTSTRIALNSSYEVIEGLFLGLNANQFRLHFFDDVPTFTTFYLDGGVLYRHSLNEEKKRYVQAGASLMDVNRASMTLESPSGQTSDVNLPSILRTGLAFHQKTPLQIRGAKEGTLELTGTVEVESVTNFEYRTMKKVGLETVFYDFLSFRIGYLTWDQNSQGFTNNLSTISNLTYGFGAKVPSSNWKSKNVPFDIYIDFTSMAPPPYTARGSRLVNMMSFSTRLVWKAKEGGSNE